MVAFVASATATNTNNTDAINVTVNKPTGTLQGHLMIAVTHGYVADTFTPPSGWIFLDFEDDSTGLRSRAYYKIAGASEPSTYQWIFQPGAGGGAIGVSISTFSGHGGLDQWNVDGNGTLDPWDWSTGFYQASSADGLAYNVLTWRDTTADTVTWTTAAEKFDVNAGDAGLTQYRGQSGAVQTVTAGVSPKFSANPTNSITNSIGWVFFIRDAVTNNSYASTGTAVELEINGTWTDVTSDVIYENGIQITRGTSSQGGQVNPSQAAFTLDNQTGKYSVLNPNSTYYPYLNLNVPCRISKAYGTVAMETLGFYDVASDDGKNIDRFRASDSNTIYIANDIDIRVDVEPETWKMHQVLAAKHSLTEYTAGLGTNYAGYVFYLDFLGVPHFYWVEGVSGSNEIHDVMATAAVPNDSIRKALRVTLDVNNGASGHTVTFYTSDTISGTWTQLGDAVIVAGTTGLNTDNNRALTVGACEPIMDGSPFTYYGDNANAYREDYVQNGPIRDSNSSTVFFEPVWHPFRGRIYGMKLYNGIAGTLVASPDFTAQSSGTKTFTDAQGNIWNAYGYVECHNRKYRHHGEITSWPQAPDNKKDYPHVDIESNGVLNRVQQGTPAENSALNRNYTSPNGIAVFAQTPGGGPASGYFGPITPLAYWPLEDNATPGVDTDAEPQTTTWTAAINRILHTDPIVLKPGSILGTVEFGADTTFFASKSAAQFNTGSMIKFPVDGAQNNGWAVEFIIYAPNGITNGTRLAEIRQNAADRIVRLTYTATNTATLTIHSADGTQVDTSGSVSFPLNAHHTQVNIFGSANFGYSLWYKYQSDRIWTSAGTASGVSSANSIYEVRLNANQLMNGAYLAHLAVFDDDDTLSYPYGSTLDWGQLFADPMDAWRREPAARRAERLTWEEGLINYNIGSGGPEMAQQGVADYASLLQEVQDVDMGYIYEPRNVLGMGYRTRTSMVNQPAMLTVGYTTNDLSGTFQPVRDNRGSINDMTVEKEFGAQGRYVKTSGTRSAAAPPNGIGRYRDQKQISLYRDRDLPYQASWRVFVGTNDDLRVDNITLALENPRIGGNSTNIYRFLKADIGHKIALTNLPTRLIPDNMSLIIVGYSEYIDQFQHNITFNCVPGSAYDLGQTVATTATTSTKAMSDATTLAEALDTTETGVDVSVASGDATWTQSGVDFDIIIGGERMTVTSIQQVTDTFTRSASSSWGTADTGQSWTNTGGSASDYSVSSNVGKQSNGTVNVGRYSTVTTPYTNADFDITVKVATDKLAAGGSEFANVVGRFADTSNHYYARLEFTTTATAIITVRKRVAGVDTQLATFTTDLTHVANTQFSIRVQMIGTAIKAKAWQSSYAEPGYWQVTATDSDITASGAVGVRSIISSAATNAPVVFSFDDFQTNALASQTFNVTRSVNGIVKTHSIGDTVELFKKSYTALGDTYE